MISYYLFLIFRLVNILNTFFIILIYIFQIKIVFIKITLIL